MTDQHMTVHGCELANGANRKLINITFVVISALALALGSGVAYATVASWNAIMLCEQASTSAATVKAELVTQKEVDKVRRDNMEQRLARMDGTLQKIWQELRERRNDIPTFTPPLSKAD